MQSMIMILSVLIIIIGLIFYFNKNKIINTQKKKSDIEQEYKNILKTKITKDEKIAFIKQCNSELARNIFFTKEEANALVQRLINI